MLTFESQDLVYMDTEEKSTRTRVSERKYYVYRFLDQQTKRAVYVYDWSGLDISEQLRQGERYYVTGYINSRMKMNWLVLTGIAQLKAGKKTDIYKQKEGITKIEPTY